MEGAIRDSRRRDPGDLLIICQMSREYQTIISRSFCDTVVHTNTYIAGQGTA